MLASLSLLALGSVASAMTGSEVVHAENKPVSRWIVELAEPMALGRRSIETPHAAFHSYLQRRGVTYSVDSHYDSKGIFVGAAVSVDEAHSHLISDAPNVISMWKNNAYTRPVITEGSQTFNSDFTKYESFAVNSTAGGVSDAYPPHVMTGVNTLHEQGILGQGQKIGIIDTGIDYRHPALGGCFGSGCKVAFGYDFVGDAYGRNGTYRPVPGPNPLDCNGHGTHCAGISAALPNPLGFTGVAPNATLGAYRIFGCTGSTYDDIIIAALTRGYEDGMNVLSLSLGGAAGWSEAPAGVVASRIARMGTAVIFAAGNDGSEGTFYASSPATGIDVIAVSSFVNTVTPSRTIVTSPVSPNPLPLYSVGSPGRTFAASNQTFPIYATSRNQTVDDACSPLPITTPNLANYVVIIRRGTCNFAIKAQNALNRGARRILIYNNVAGTISPDFGANATMFEGGVTSAEAGAYLVSQFAAGNNITVSFPSVYVDFANPLGGLLSNFTSYGFTNDLYLKPQVGAPGENILSTWLTTAGAYNVISGTSMACPFIAGTAALYTQVNGGGKIDTLKLRSVLESSSVPVTTSKNGSVIAPAVQQGGGLINASLALYTKTYIQPGELLLNDTANFRANHVLTISNSATSNRTYTFSHTLAATAYTFANTSNATYTPQPALNPVPLSTIGASVTLPQTLVVPAGGMRNASLTFSPPVGLNAGRLPLYSGFISIRCTETGEQFSVPYGGVAASMRDQPVFDASPEYFGVRTPALLNYQTEDFATSNASYTFSNRTMSYFSVVYRILIGSPQVTYELTTAASTTSSPSILGPVARAEMYAGRNTPDSNNASVGYYENIFYGPFSYTNGSRVPNGSYKLLVRGLRTFARNTSDYESFLSPTFAVNQ